jgi:tRNA pseudouridine55 synthase
MKDKIRIVYKKPGQTPLDCIDELKKNDKNLSHLPITYAGRLDPLAEGLLVLLIGSECHNKDEYLKLPKEYEVTILFGFATDTYDLMGKVVKSPELIDKKFSQADIVDIIPQFTGRIKQFYPPYSSRTVKGKPLYQWSREGKIDEISIPSHDVFVEKIEIIKEGEIKGDKLLSVIKKNISYVKGDFRQTEIINIWHDILKEKKEEIYQTITLRINCGSGVYVRGLAHEIGVNLGIPALALKIVRTKVGEYKIN